MDKIPSMIPLSRFNRGYAGKILENIKQSDEPTVIIKNNEPIAVVISVDLYNSLAVNSYRKPLDFVPKKHVSAGSLHKYARKDLIGKEEELYHQAMDLKYGKQ